MTSSSQALQNHFSKLRNIISVNKHGISENDKAMLMDESSVFVNLCKSLIHQGVTSINKCSEYINKYGELIRKCAVFILASHTFINECAVLIRKFSKSAH